MQCCLLKRFWHTVVKSCTCDVKYAFLIHQRPPPTPRPSRSMGRSVCTPGQRRRPPWWWRHWWRHGTDFPSAAGAVNASVTVCPFSLVISPPSDADRQLQATAIRTEMALFATTGHHGRCVLQAFDYLMTVPVKFVEAERAFSAAAILCSKLRLSLGETPWTVDSLCFLRSYYRVIR